jgi:hypothetical protein
VTPLSFGQKPCSSLPSKLATKFFTEEIVFHLGLVLTEKRVRGVAFDFFFERLGGLHSKLGMKYKRKGLNLGQFGVNWTYPGRSDRSSVNQSRLLLADLALLLCKLAQSDKPVLPV